MQIQHQLHVALAVFVDALFLAELTLEVDGQGAVTVGYGNGDVGERSWLQLLLFKGTLELSSREFEIICIFE